jgi:hypothetical protein
MVAKVTERLAVNRSAALEELDTEVDIKNA